MKEMKQLEIFLKASINDNRLNSIHISLYLALFIKYKEHDFRNPFPLIGTEIMRTSRIRDRSLYFLFLEQLQQYGYIRYFPSRSPLRLSMAQLLKLKFQKLQ